MGKRGRLNSPEFRAETVRLVQASDEDHLVSKISKDLDVPTETLRNRVNQTEIDSGQREGLTTEEREELHTRPDVSRVEPRGFEPLTSAVQRRINRLPEVSRACKIAANRRILRLIHIPCFQEIYSGCCTVAAQICPWRGSKSQKGHGPYSSMIRAEITFMTLVVWAKVGTVLTVP
jgi:transposase-like protein